MPWKMDVKKRRMIDKGYVTNNGRKKAMKTGKKVCPEFWTRFYIQKAVVP